MNLCIFFEGTGKGVTGKITNVTRMFDLCASDTRQLLHLEKGPGTRFGSYLLGKIAGVDWRAAFRGARRFFEAHYRSLPDDSVRTHVYIFGFSRGALLARHFAAWLDKLSVSVDYLGIWDTVDATMGLEVAEECPANVMKARHAVARDEDRKFFGYLPLSGPKTQVAELLFPGAHSDIGGLYQDNHLMADLTLSWIAQGAKTAKIHLAKGAKLTQKLDQKQVILHDSHTLASNLWGAFDRVKRKFASIRLHRACKGM